MNINIVKEDTMPSCFGHYVFESIECMTCKNCTQCQSDKSSKEAERKIEIYPDCKGCMDVSHCKKSPRNCMGDYLYCDSSDAWRCDCNFSCQELSFDRNYNCDITVIKDVNAAGYSNNVILKKGEHYKGALSKYGLLWIMYNNSLKAIFDTSYDVYKNYVEITMK